MEFPLQNELISKGIKLLPIETVILNQVYRDGKKLSAYEAADVYSKANYRFLKDTYSVEDFKALKKLAQSVYSTMSDKVNKTIEESKKDKERYEKIYKVKKSDFLQGNNHLTAAFYINFLANQELKVTGFRKDSHIVENLLALPPFVTDYYEFLFENGRPANQKEFKESYMTKHKTYIDLVLPKEEVINLEHRIARAYPSLVRDDHAYFVAIESGLFNKVGFSVYDDIERKMDQIAQVDFGNFGLQFRTLTARSDSFYNKKKKRSPIAINVLAVDCPIDFWNDRDNRIDVKTKGDTFYLYSPNFFIQVKRNMEKTYNLFVSIVNRIDPSLKNSIDAKFIFNNLEEENRTYENFLTVYNATIPSTTNSPIAV